MIVVTKEKRSKEITTNLDSRQVFANKPLIRELTWRVRTWRRPDGIRLGGGAVRLVWGNVADLVRSALFLVSNSGVRSPGATSLAANLRSGYPRVSWRFPATPVRWPR